MGTLRGTIENAKVRQGMRDFLMPVLHGAIYAMLIATAFSKDVEPYSVALKGNVESIEVNRSIKSTVVLNIKLKLELINNGQKPLIFLTAKKPILVGVSLAKSETDLIAGKILVKDYYGPSAESSAEWKRLRDLLNKSKIPGDQIRVLIPSESVPLNPLYESVSMAMPTESGMNSFIPRREKWETIHALSIAWIRAICDVWPLSLESPGRERANLSFGKSLQKRWKNSGLLWLTPITSEPIMLDLSHVQR
jgi:hypothetical protein